VRGSLSQSSRPVDMQQLWRAALKIPALECERAQLAVAAGHPF
jgi:hypothetical protein